MTGPLSVNQRITRIVVALYTPGQRTPLMKIEQSGGTRLVDDTMAKVRAAVDIINDEVLTDGKADAE